MVQNQKNWQAPSSKQSPFGGDINTDKTVYSPRSCLTPGRDALRERVRCRRIRLAIPRSQKPGCRQRRHVCYGRMGQSRAVLTEIEMSNLPRCWCYLLQRRSQNVSSRVHSPNQTRLRTALTSHGPYLTAETALCTRRCCRSRFPRSVARSSSSVRPGPWTARIRLPHLTADLPAPAATLRFYRLHYVSRDANVAPSAGNGCELRRHNALCAVKHETIVPTIIHE